jgi:hypothetical protein
MRGGYPPDIDGCGIIAILAGRARPPFPTNAPLDRDLEGVQGEVNSYRLPSEPDVAAFREREDSWPNRDAMALAVHRAAHREPMPAVELHTLWREGEPRHLAPALAGKAASASAIRTRQARRCSRQGGRGSQNLGTKCVGVLPSLIARAASRSAWALSTAQGSLRIGCLTARCIALAPALGVS